jgi:AMMECR1 domain-containing protein
MESVISENLKKPKGVFVTLTENGELRGASET